MPAVHTVGLLGGRSFAWGKGLLKGRVATLPSCVKQTSRLTTCEDVAERPSDEHETGSNGAPIVISQPRTVTMTRQSAHHVLCRLTMARPASSDSRPDR